MWNVGKQHAIFYALHIKCSIFRCSSFTCRPKYEIRSSEMPLHFNETARCHIAALTAVRNLNLTLCTLYITSCLSLKHTWNLIYKSHPDLKMSAAFKGWLVTLQTAKSRLKSVRPSVRGYEKTREQLKLFPWNFVLGSFNIPCLHIPVLAKT